MKWLFTIVIGLSVHAFALLPLSPGVVRQYLDMGCSIQATCVRNLVVREAFREIRNLYGNTARPPCYTKGYEDKDRLSWIVFVFTDEVRLLPGLPLESQRLDPSVALGSMVWQSVKDEDRVLWKKWIEHSL